MSGLLSRFRSKVIPIIRIHGSINHKMTDQVTQQLQSIKSTNAKVLAVSLNSPGGLPGQAEIISNKLKHFANQKKLPLLTFAEGLCASAGHYILSSGDQAFASKTSIVGSIGAISILWRLKQLMDYNNIEVRKFTSSEDLLLYQMDPLNEGSEKQKRIFQQLLDNIHKQFIGHIVQTRGNKLKGDPEKMFDGSTFLGEQALQLGLIDGLGSMIEILADRYPEQKLFNIATKKTRLQNFTKYIMG